MIITKIVLVMMLSLILSIIIGLVLISFLKRLKIGQRLSEYLENAQILLSGMVEKFGEEDFFVVDNAEKASHAFEVLNARIVDYHKKDGVVFFGENTIFVDVDVQIESGAIIYPNNIINI